jgi:hypothetical protein
MRVDLNRIGFLLWLAAPLAGDPSGADFLLLEPTARAVAQGGAYSAQSGRTEGLRYNPASLQGLRGLQASLAHVNAPGDWAYDWAGVGFRFGAFGLGAEYLGSSLKPFTLYDATGTAVGEAAAGSQNIALGAAAPLPLPGGWLKGGAAVRYFRSQLYLYEAQGGSVDLGLQACRKDWPVSLGLSLQNLGVESAYISEADPLPACARAGLQAKLPLDRGLLLMPAVDLVAYLDPTRPLEIRSGIEVDVFDRVGLRAGLLNAGSYHSLSFGMGLNWDGWGLDYAFLPANELGAEQMIELHIASGR